MKHKHRRLIERMELVESRLCARLESRAFSQRFPNPDWLGFFLGYPPFSDYPEQRAAIEAESRDWRRVRVDVDSDPCHTYTCCRNIHTGEMVTIVNGQPEPDSVFE